MQDKELPFHAEVENSPRTITAFIKEQTKLPNFDLSKAVFCMEHTGIYSHHLLSCLHKMGAKVCLEAATQIKNSLGNLRGKNDKIDAVRIADYAYRNSERLRLWTPKRDVVVKLAQLSATRSRLITVKKMLTVPIKETGGFLDKKTAAANAKLCKTSIDGVQKDLTRIEKAIDELIDVDAELKRLYRLVSSVVGIGKVTATEVLITTNEFRDIKEAKKFACYCGVAPPSPRNRVCSRVGPEYHIRANKKMKTLLHLAALVALQHNKDLKTYYERKVSEERKNKMCVINAIRNKLVLRIFACVNQGKEYEINYQKLVA